MTANGPAGSPDIMAEQARDTTTYGLGGQWGWLLGGAAGGAVGSLLFGIVLWLVDPTIVTESIPAIYGFDPGTVGWGFHLFHGIVLGVIFGFLVSRDMVIGTLAADVETGFIAVMGLTARFMLAGMVYGLAVFAILPLLVLPIWIGISGASDPAFPGGSLEILVGHLVYGLLLGALFSVFVETGPKAAESDAPFEEASDTPGRSS